VRPAKPGVTRIYTAAFIRRPCGEVFGMLPVDTYVRSYASVVSLGREGIEYRQLSAPDKMILDQCVSDTP
jgi:hypothetical protein